MFTLNVNGQTYQVNVPGDTRLLWVLRDILGLTGTKYGCGIEICWACTVMVDGQAEKSCDMDVSSAAGRQITTIEGLSPDGVSHPLQKAWIAEQVPQCGYCQSGMMMAAAALLQQKPHPTDSDINEIHNVCICGTYQRIRAAIKRAANGG
jgi:isoquinoline 1-oxidoreductase subunit alpha